MPTRLRGTREDTPIQTPLPENQLREENGTGAGADEEELGVTDEELDDLEDDAEGG